MINHKLNLLVVDDDASLASFISYALTKMSYTPRIASSGKEALALLRDDPADILITDIHMPGMSGLELTEEVLRIYPDTIVIAVTGRGDINIAVEFMKLGGIDFLQKPVNVSALRLAVGSAADRQRLRKELKRAEQNYQNIWESAPIGIYQSSPEGRFISVNPVLARMLGYSSPDEMISSVTNIAEHLYIQPSQRESLIQHILEYGEWMTIEDEFFRKDKSIIFAKVTLRAALNDDGGLLYIEGFVEDITEKKKQEDIFNLEMSRAKEIYDLIVKPQLPMIKGLRINVKCLPAENVGGDVVEFLKISEKCLLIFLADVTGHGIPAAMTANTAKTLFREIAETYTNPAMICRHLNDIVSRITLPDDIIASFCAQIDLEAMTLTYCLCGIPAPIILRNHENICLEPTGFPLGAFHDAVYEDVTLSLSEDDLLVAFTDGITEVRSEKGEIFGLNGVKQSIGKEKHDISSLVECIKESAEDFQQKHSCFQDDVIILAVSLFDEDNGNTCTRPWNRFCSSNKYLLEMKTRHIRIDDVTDFFMGHVAEKSGLSSEKTGKLRVAFFEVLLNAIEHGNLKLTDLKKNPEFFDSEKYRDMFENRMNSEKCGDKLIRIECQYSPEKLEVSVEDEGSGFEVESISDPRANNNISSSSGRGIYIAGMSVDRVMYNATGNKVTLTWMIK
ncbi:SpoIIE family protein phosphatase [Desulfococcaceae bacterium HSG8]|nr:SpoIIE family protein phosphatase [Desulfococcaceae bacterium HSG8]